jgi:metal-responsive CopG/Arc/MetJ family transcriptional regulator
MKTVQMTLDEHLLQTLDQEAKRNNQTRSAFIRMALQAELKRRQNEALEAIHRASFLETPDDDVWYPIYLSSV